MFGWIRSAFSEMDANAHLFHGRRFTNRMKVKLAIVVVLAVLAFLVVITKLFYIIRNHGDEYKKQILSQQATSTTTIPYKRGDILDRNGTELAYSVKVYNVILDAYVVNENDEIEDTITALTTCFDLDATELRTYITENPSSRYKILLKKQTYDQIEAFLNVQSGTVSDIDITVSSNSLSSFDVATLESLGSISGVWFEEEYKRVYPYSTMACDLIGFTVSYGSGSYGLEEYYNDVLTGTNGREYSYINSDYDVAQTTVAAVDGQSLVTTIDANIQAIVEKYVEQWNEEYENNYRSGELGSKNTGVIVMDPNTGEILAMAGYPFYDLNNPRDLSVTGLYTDEEIAAMTDDELTEARAAVWKNFCISDTYEPGSVAKALTISLALDSGSITGDETYFCGGVYEVSGHQIKCHKRVGHGTVTVSNALEQSCNVALMQIGQAIGNTTFMKYLSNFNMGLKTNIDLTGEARTDTLIYDVDTMVASDLAISTFGQGYNCTMIQMAAAFASVVNGGYYYQPHVVKEILNADGTIAETIDARVLKQTISESTSEVMREYLANVCTIGTGTSAVPAGYLIGGKTGTAEMYPRNTGNYVVSFCGFAPVDDPEVLIYVVIDRPNTDDQAHSTYAQEICKNILTEILPYLQIFRTEELTEEEEAELQELGVISNKLSEVTIEDILESENDAETTETSISAIIDSTTGYAVDPNTGEYLDPDTYEPVDSTSSDLDGIGALIDETLSED